MAVIPIHERKHLWERHPDEVPTPSLLAQVGGDGEFPRTMHKGGETRTVTTGAEKAAALADGWFLTPDEEQAVPALTQDGTNEG